MLFTAYLTDHQRNIWSFMQHLTFWTRSVHESITENKLKEIWEDIERNINELDMLLTLNILSQLVGKKTEYIY